MPDNPAVRIRRKVTFDYVVDVPAGEYDSYSPEEIESEELDKEDSDIITEIGEEEPSLEHDTEVTFEYPPGSGEYHSLEDYEDALSGNADKVLD